MKRCGYCGRDNQSDAIFCRECGTEFAAKIPVTKTELTSKAIESGSETFVELQRYRDPESVAQLGHILDAAGITYKRSSLAPIYQITKIGTNDGGDSSPIIVSVPKHQYAAARAALESDYLKIALPEGHYLLTSTDEELAEIVGQSSEWSAFDVAHARRLISERGVAVNRIEDKRAEYLKKLQRGKPASKKLIFFGWLFSILGGLIGFGIGWSLCYMKETTPDGVFFTYNKNSRVVGKMMMAIAGTEIATAILLRLLR